ACGAWKPGELPLADGAAAGVLDFLETAKLTPHALSMGKRVAVIGGGNTAMDAARAAKQVPGVEQVLLLYRRTRRQMPADAEELALALADGVEFHELLAPVSFRRAVLTCKVMALGPPDESGRRGPIPTGETVSFPVDTLISAVGEQVDSAFLARSGVPLDRRGRPAALRANDRLFVIGDARRGPATVVEAIADATAAVEAILGVRPASAPFAGDAAVLRARRGVLALPQDPCDEARCLGCAQICELCVEVCPNRANLSVLVPGAAEPQVVHVDAMCNECGNCATFCPYEGAPYRDKWTLFSREADFADSENQGFLPLSGGGLRLRLNGAVFDAAPDDARIPTQLRALIQAVLRDVPHCQSPKGVL
ncbi:MAG: FAD-dependent oxidoreductase, partial [Clostridiales bacterium]|nr:FAD-dependent oxidoreductase [Clostridiales bacterium]